MDPVGGGSGTHGSTGGHRTGAKRSASQMDPSSPRLPSKRKPGPIPRHIVVRRPASPSPPSSPLSSPNSSPCPSPLWFSPDPPPPLLTPVTPTGMSLESSRGEALVTGPDSEGSEPPKLTMVNGDMGELKTGNLHSHSYNIHNLYFLKQSFYVCLSASIQLKFSYLLDPFP